MRLKIKNFRGVKAAEIDLRGVTVVGGPNAAGKSSVAMALQAALSGEPVPIAGVRKADAGLLVKSGAGRGSVELESDSGKISVDYPQARVATEGNPPAASRHALGLDDVTRMPAKEVAPILAAYLQADPQLADLEAAVARLGLKRPPDVAEIWKEIRELGWDGAHARRRESGARLKGQWQGVTSETYGPTKAATWAPEGWGSDLANAAEAELEREATLEAESLEAAIVGQALDEDRRRHLENVVAQIAPLREAGYELTLKIRDLEIEARKAAEEVRRVPCPPAALPRSQCPHCGATVAVQGATLSIPSDDDAAAADATYLVRRKDAADAHEKAEADLRVAVRKAAEINLDLGRATKAEAELAAANGSTSREELAAARERARLANERLDAFRRHRQAAALHEQIENGVALLEVLAPTGLRTARLREVIRGFNTELAALCRTAGWDLVELEADLSITLGGRSLVMLSESERYRAAVILRFALAALDRSSAVVIDAADVLDGGGRNGLMRLALGHEAPVLICMTLRAGALPALGERGRAYWIADGVAEG